MKAKKIVTLLVAAALTCGVVGSTTSVYAADVTLKLAHADAEGTIFDQGAVAFQEKLQELSGGTMDVELYRNGTLGSLSEVAEGIQMGTVDVAPIVTTTLANFASELNAFDMPYGKKAGIIGLGRIGRDTASLCTGIGMKVAGYDPFLTKEQIEGMGYEYYANYEDLLKDCDVISIHVPLTKETENMVSAKQLKEMKNTAIIINCSRGGIINEADLIEALDSGEIAGAGLDVFVGEEIHPGNPLLDAKNLIFSPHSAAQTREAVINMATMCVEGCKAVCAGKKWKLVANPDVYKHEKWKDAEWA